MGRIINKFAITFISLVGLSLTSCGNSNNSEYKYVYNNAILSSPKAWNPHNWETSDEHYIASYTTMGFYQVGLNEERNGYKIYKEMASSFPLDKGSEVTIEDKKKYGYLGQVDDGYVYDLELNPLATWEDGTKIKAKDYVDSMERILSPKMANFRADSYYASNFVVANAETYFKQGKITTEPLYYYILNNEGVPSSEDILFDNTYLLNLGKFGDYFQTIFKNQGDQGSFYSCLASRPRKASDKIELAAQRIVDAAQYYIFNYVSHEGKDGWQDVTQPSSISDDEKLDCDIDIYDFNSNKILVRKEKDQALDENDPSSYEKYSTNLLKTDLLTFVQGIGGGTGIDEKDWAWMLPLFAHKENNEKCEFDDVGIKAIDDYTIRLFLTQKMTIFDLEFALTSNWLVKVDLYDKLTQKMPASELYGTSYGTHDASTYMSYGPYKLSNFIIDSAIEMVKNEKWYGYSDNLHAGLYQCEKINTRVISNRNTIKMMFLKGELDEMELQKSDMKDYGNSSRVKFIPESYTQKISLNSDRNKLKTRQDQTSQTDDNKTILNNLSFRKALSLSINRQSFASQATAGSSAFTGLLNSLYLVDSVNGVSYRSTKQGQSVYDKVYSKLGGENGGEMLNPSEVAQGYTDNRSGFNEKYAINLVKKAIEEESTKEDGYRAGQKVTIEFLVSQSPDESETIKNAYDLLTSCFNKVTQPSGMQVVIECKKDEDYYTTAQNGNYDMIYSIWGGAVNNPYGLMQVYIDQNFSKCCEYGFKGKQKDISLEIEFSNGDKTTKTFYAWFDDIIKNLVEPSKNEGEERNEDQIAEYERVHNKRLDVLAGVEAGVLSRFEAIPLVSRSMASMSSYKVSDGVENYITFVGYGGIRELKFNHTVDQWNEFLNKNGNNLSEAYKK